MAKPVNKSRRVSVILDSENREVLSVDRRSSKPADRKISILATYRTTDGGIENVAFENGDSVHSGQSAHSVTSKNYK